MSTTTTTATQDYTQEEIQSLVVQAIAENCTQDSSHSDLRAVAESLSAGHEIELELLTGGLCNYSYKVSVPSDPKAPLLFTKLALPYPLLARDWAYSVERLENEFKWMQIYQNAIPESQRQTTITPYFCADVTSEMKLLVTQWSPINKMLGSQFVDGRADLRVASNLADQLAALHSFQCDDAEENFESPELTKSQFMDMFGNAEAFKGVSEAELNEIWNSMSEMSKLSQCYTHGDCHPFNMLIDDKPSTEGLEKFDEEGNVVIIDWETAKRAYPGRDLGRVYGFPVLCVLAHTLNGNIEFADNMFNFLDTFWEEYCSEMHVRGDGSQDFSQIYRQLLTECGFYFLLNTLFAVHTEHLPLEEGNTVMMANVKKSLGKIAVKFYRIGLGLEDSNLSLPELRQKFKSIIAEEQGSLLRSKDRRRTPRRSSLLRSSLVM